MRRGDVIIIREPNTPASKARPYVVVQRDITLQNATKITGCPITSTIQGRAGQRPIIVPSDQNGLRHPSEVEIDWTFTHPLERIGGRIGSLDEDTMKAIDMALRRWLEL